MLVTQVFAVLLEYLKDPDSSPTVQARGAGARGGLHGFSRATIAAHNDFEGQVTAQGLAQRLVLGMAECEATLAEGSRRGPGSHGL